MTVFANGFSSVPRESTGSSCFGTLVTYIFFCSQVGGTEEGLHVHVFVCFIVQLRDPLRLVEEEDKNSGWD